MSIERMYDSGGDFSLDYREMRMTFGEGDFKDRLEYAARRLKLVEAALTGDEMEDLVSLVTEDEAVTESRSPLAEHIYRHYEGFFPDSGNNQPVLTDWLRRLMFRGAWLDQRVLSGELDVEFDMESGDFIYVYDDPDRTPVAMTPEPSWHHVTYYPPA